MRHLEDVGPELDGGVGQDGVLLRLAEIAERDERQAVLDTCRGRVDPHRETRRVALPGRGATLRLRPENAPRRVAERERRTRGERPDHRAVGRESCDDALARRLTGIGHRDLRDASRERVRGADMIVIEVREHEQIDPIDPEQVEAPIEQHVVRTGVDERDALGRPDEQGIPLTDVARREPPRRRPRQPLVQPAAERQAAPQHEDEHRDATDGEPESTERCLPRPRSHERGDTEQERGERGRAGHARQPRPARPGPRRDGGRDHADPLRREPCEPQHRCRHGR